MISRAPGPAPREPGHRCRGHDGPGVADSLRELGRFLIEQQGKRDEGCQLLHEAIRLYAGMGLPGEVEARATVQVLSCDA